MNNIVSASFFNIATVQGTTYASVFYDLLYSTSTTLPLSTERKI